MIQDQDLVGMGGYLSKTTSLAIIVSTAVNDALNFLKLKYVTILNANSLKLSNKRVHSEEGGVQEIFVYE